MAKTLLFISEDITLAQMVRLQLLAKSLPENEYNIHFASGGHFLHLASCSSFVYHSLSVIAPAAAEKAVYNCQRIYEEDLLQQYIREELDLFQKVKPDIIIGDFRLSLTISASLANIPLAVLINAYWNKEALMPDFPMPDHPMEKVLGHQQMKFFYSFLRPFAFQHFARPFNNVRKKYNLPEIGSLQEVLTYGNYVLHPDTPYICPQKMLPPHHLFLGPVIWSPAIKPDDRLKKQMEHKYIYVTLGSSGRTGRIRNIIEGLRNVPFHVIMASAGKFDFPVPENFLLYPFLPGDQMAEGAEMVICNGGSTTGYQALQQGKPVLGIASNLDQHLCMTRIQQLGAGKILRAGTVTAQQVTRAVQEIIHRQHYYDQAASIRENMQKYHYQDIFQRFLEKI